MKKKQGNDYRSREHDGKTAGVSFINRKDTW